jgi:hypothetical protein
MFLEGCAGALGSRFNTLKLFSKDENHKLGAVPVKLIEENFPKF